MSAPSKADPTGDPAGRPAASAQRPPGRNRPPGRGGGGPDDEQGAGQERRPEPSAGARAEAERLLRRLTRREAQVLARLAAGDDDRATAAALGITPATARTHLRKAMRKLGVTSSAEAARLAALLTLPTDAPRPNGRPAAVPDAAGDSAVEDTPTPGTAAPDTTTSDPTTSDTAVPDTAVPDTADRPRSASTAATPPAPAPAPAPPPASPVLPAAARSGAGIPPADFAAFTAAVHARLAQQTFLVTGSARTAGRCVRAALGAAGARWAEVSALPDPEGWVRAAAFDSALAPWRRSTRRRGRRYRRRAASDGTHDRELVAALRRLSRARRRAVVLHDAVGLPVPLLAAEVEASSAAAQGRVLAARAELARALPSLLGEDPLAPGFGQALGGLLHDTAVRACPAPVPPAPDRLARAGRLRAGRATAAAALLTAAMGGAMLVALVDGEPAGRARPPARVVVAPPPEVCSAAGTGSAGPAAPGRAPGLRSPWCSPAPPEAAAAPPDDSAPAAGPSDAGTPSDAGSPSDTGTPSDTGSPGAGPTAGGSPPSDAASDPAGTSVSPAAADGAAGPGGGSLVPVAVPCAPYWPCPTLAPSALPYPVPGGPPAVR